MKLKFMNIRSIFLLFILALATTSVNAQIAERERPADWKQLVKGARFMDRFLPMPEGHQEKDIWGAKDVQLRFVDNGIELPEISFWGGNILQTLDKKYHLFVCGWPENSPKGHMFWPKSTVFHATSDCLSGPYAIQDTIGKGHNPEAFILKDGRVVVYVIDGYYIADSVNGPWRYSKFGFDPRDRKIIEGLSNLTFARRGDGSYLMICRGGGVWISRTGLSSYMQLTDKRVYPAVEGRFEDPVVWKDDLQYHLIVNDWLGRIAFYQRSKDGVHWVTEQGEAYVPGVSFHKDGTIENWFKYERPKVFQDQHGRVAQMNFAVIDTIKWQDLPNDNHSSKNICIPLNKGLLLSVLNKKRITDDIKSKIEVRIHAEEGFDPQKEVDVESLHFGSYTEVNYGRGSRPVRTKNSGTDLIVIFEGKGSGITVDEFAPKLIGKNKKGDMIYGYARLPYVDYQPAILSARCPIYNKDKKEIRLEIQNFGLSNSLLTEVEVIGDGKHLTSGKVKTLKPYEKVELSLKSSQTLVADKKVLYEVVFYQQGVEVERCRFK